MSDKDKNTVNLSKDTLHHVIEGNLDLLCQEIKDNVARQWVCVILLMQFIEYLLKYQIQSSGNEFPTKHDLKLLYGALTENDQERIEVCFDKLTRNLQRKPEFNTIKVFVNRYHNSYTLLRYDVLEENFSRNERYFYIADTFLVLIALMECSDIDFDICKARNMQKWMVKQFDKIIIART